MQSNMEQMYREALNPQLYPDARLLAVLQGHDTSLPMSVAMAAKQQRDQLETSAQGQQAMQQAKQPSIRDQMAQQGQQQMVAQQQPQNLMMQEGQESQAGLDQLPASNLKSMAGGGIVAFASGGNALSSTWDDDSELSDEDKEDREYAYLNNALKNAGHGIQHFGSQIMDAMPQGIQNYFGAQPAPQQAAPQQAAQAQPTGIKGIMDSALQKYSNVSPQLAQYVLKKETGGMPDPANAVSKAGAQGYMQIMPKTAQGLGITNPFDPEQNIHGGIKYLSQLMTKYQHPKLALMAYNWGPGNVDKWLKHGQKDSAVPKETRNYVADANFAAGGGVKGFSGVNGISLVDPLSEFGPSATTAAEDTASWARPSIDTLLGKSMPSGTSLPEGFSPATQESWLSRNVLSRIPNLKQAGLGAYLATYSPDLNSGEADLVKRLHAADDAAGANGATPGTVVPPAPPAKPAVANAGAGANTGAGDNNQTQPSPAPSPNTLPQGGMPSLDEYYNKSQSRIDEALEDLRKQRKQASGLGIFTAGLGMIGKSPFAGENIKEGALAGINQYGQDVKGIGALQNQVLGAQAALDKNRISAAIQHENRMGALDQKQDLVYTRQLSDYDKMIDAEIANKNKTAITPLSAQDETNYRLQRRRELIKNNPKLYTWYENQGGNVAPTSVQLPSAPGNVLGTLKTQ